MSSSVPSKRQYSPNRLAGGKGLLDWFLPFLRSTVGAKMIVALTGLALTSFVVVHLIGNLKLLAGRDSINGYAAFLKSLGPLLWIARIGLFAIFALHLVLVLRLKFRARAGRPVRYIHPATIQATIASRTMLYSGLVILAFVLFHLAHLSFGWIATTEAIDLNATDGAAHKVTANYMSLVDRQGRHDVYSMVVAGLGNPLIALLYILAQVALFMHLSHGISSVLQSIGLNAPRFQPSIKICGYALSFAVAFGNVFLVVAVWTGWVPVLDTYVNTVRN